MAYDFRFPGPWTYKIGTDQVEVGKIRKIFAGNESLQENTFGQEELNYARRQRHRFLHLAELFAIKEAFFKALETGLSGDMKWLDIEVQRERASLKLRGQTAQVARGVGVIADYFSSSHTDELAVALVVLVVDRNIYEQERYPSML